METPESFKTLREPIMIGPYRLFGDVLPFIGFEDVEIDTKDIPELGDRQGLPTKVVGAFFTVEWFGRGWSFGKFTINLNNE
jgi:hypothetical protein